MSENMSTRPANRIPPTEKCATCDHFASSHARINREHTKRGECYVMNENDICECMKFVRTMPYAEDAAHLDVEDIQTLNEIEDEIVDASLSPEEIERYGSYNFGQPTGNKGRPLFTQKHYEAIADALAHEGRLIISTIASHTEFWENSADAKDSFRHLTDVSLYVNRLHEWQVSVNLLAWKFRDDNPRFDWDKFKEICGYPAANAVFTETINLVRENERQVLKSFVRSEKK